MTFDAFLRSVCPEFDLEWRKYRRRASRRRVAGRMRELGMKDWGEYRLRLLEDAAEAADFPDLLRVTVTRFFRERECWDELALSIPSLLSPGQVELRAWSAGCAGGEEPYSLAILWRDRLQPDYPGVALNLHATDIDEESLTRAESALYSTSSLREAGADILARWFEGQGDLYRVRAEIRRLVRFAKRPLMDAPPLDAVDLLLCRYLPFTYYRRIRLHGAMLHLAAALRPGGLLMIGRKESLPPGAEEFFQREGKTGALWRRL
jgi:chemotaxis methyl-accepting protein methylase